MRSLKSMVLLNIQNNIAMEKPTKAKAIQLLKMYFVIAEKRRLILNGVANISLTYEQKVSRVNSLGLKLLEVTREIMKVDLKTIK